MQMTPCLRVENKGKTIIQSYAVKPCQYIVEGIQLHDKKFRHLSVHINSDRALAAKTKLHKVHQGGYIAGFLHLLNPS